MIFKRKKDGLPLMNDPGAFTEMGNCGKRVLKKKVKDILFCWACCLVSYALFELIFHYFTCKC